MSEGMSGGGGGGAPSQGGGQQSGQSGGGQTGYAQPQVQRARVNEFSGFSAGIMPQQSGQPLLDQGGPMGADGIPGQRIAVQDRGLVEQGGTLDPNDPFFSGMDAQSQALAVSDDPLAPIDPNQQPDDGSVQAEAMSAAEAQAAYEQFISWRDGDDLAEPLMDKFVVARVDGQQYRIPVREAVKGYQLHSDYSNKLRELYAYRNNLEKREAGLQKLLEDMDDGQKFLDAMVFLGKFPGFSKAAIIYGTQLDAERRMTPEQRQVHANLRAMRAHLQKLEIENRNLRGALPQEQAPQPDQGPNPQQMYQIYMQQLQHILPRVQQKVGFVASPYAQAEFERHFNQMLPMIAGQDLTSEFVENVMRAAMESVENQVAQHRGFVQQVQGPGASPQQYQQQRARPQNGQQAQQQARRLPPAGQMPGPSQPAQQQRQQRSRIGDFDRAVRAPRQF